MKFNHLVQRSAKTAESMDEHIKQKQDPHEIINDLQTMIQTSKRSGRREEIELADKFKQRVVHEFEREGRQYSKAWITKVTHANSVHGNNIIEYIKRLKEIDGAFNQMKAKDCEMDIEELVTSVKTSYRKNNDCIATLSGVEGNIIELQGKVDRERNALVADLERISRLNNQRQTDEETKLRIQNLIKNTTDKRALDIQTTADQLEDCCTYLGDVYKYWFKSKADLNTYKVVNPDNIGREVIGTKRYLCKLLVTRFLGRCGQQLDPLPQEQERRN